MTTRQMIKRFLEPIKNHKGAMTNMILFDLFSVGQVIFLVLLVQNVIQSIEKSDINNFHYWIFIMLGINILGAIAKIIRKPYIFKIYGLIRKEVDQIYLKKILYGNNNTFEKRGTGKLIGIYAKGSETWGDLLTNFFSDGMTTLFLFITFLITTGTKNIQLFYGSLGVLLFVIIWFITMSGISQPYREKTKNILIEKSRMQIKWFMNKFEILQSNQLKNEIQKGNILYKEWFFIVKIEKFYQSFAFDIPFLLASLLFTGLVWISGKQVMNGELSYADMTGIVGIGTIFMKDLDNIIKRFRFFFDKGIDIKKLRELCNTIEVNQQNIDNGNIFIIKNNTLVYKNIYYGYEKNNIILNNLSLTIHGKQKTALVGPSGGGKSTLIKLIAGYLQPDSGSVIVDGQDLKDVALLSYYKHIGYLTQDPSVFDGTIRENLEYGISNESVSETQQSIETIIPLAKCERIYDLPNGLDTEIGERGVRLSGGQKQRLAIAKIMLKNPDIILLDEPTSALDSANEQAVTEALNNLFKNKTVIIIAHRLQTVKNADEIIYIDDGKVIERGTHAELLALGGEYYTMVELQSGF